MTDGEKMSGSLELSEKCGAFSTCKNGSLPTGRLTFTALARAAKRRSGSRSGRAVTRYAAPAVITIFRVRFTKADIRIQTAACIRKCARIYNFKLKTNTVFLKNISKKHKNVYFQFIFMCYNKPISVFRKYEGFSPSEYRKVSR